MRIALVGPRGQLGSALQACLTGDVVPLERQRIDIADPEQVDVVIREVRPDVVINAAAYNFVDRAEDEPDAALRVNAQGPGHLAAACQNTGATIVHVSSDYVFGSDAQRRTPYREEDSPGPQGAYARSKRGGEQTVIVGCRRHFVVRTCGLYGRAASPGKGNFVETMLRLGRERGEVSVVDDQWCTPTFVRDLAAWIVRLIETDRFGLYHATNGGSTTWRQFAEEIFRQSGLKVNVRPITTVQFGAKAPRPAYSVLDCAKLAGAIGVQPRPWQEALAQYLQERGGNAGE